MRIFYKTVFILWGLLAVHLLNGQEFEDLLFNEPGNLGNVQDAISLRQLGDFNQFILIASQTQGVRTLQNGERNTSNIRLSGNANQLLLDQRGNANSVNLALNGNNNQFSIQQRGNRNALRQASSGLNKQRFLIQQFGSGHSIDIMGRTFGEIGSSPIVIRQTGTRGAVILNSQN